MKFAIGDKVKIIGGAHFVGKVGEIIQIISVCSNLYLITVSSSPDGWTWKNESDLELVSQQTESDVIPNESLIRAFETGATRDTVAGKLSYMKALSPEVLEAYVIYLDKHRKQSDGSMREFDNWKRGIDKWTYLDSLLRHDKAVWNLMLGYEVSDNHGPVTLLDSLMATIFNAMGLAYELLIEEGKVKRQGQKRYPNGFNKISNR